MNLTLHLNIRKPQWVYIHTFWVCTVFINIHILLKTKIELLNFSAVYQKSFKYFDFSVSIVLDNYAQCIIDTSTSAFMLLNTFKSAEVEIKGGTFWFTSVLTLICLINWRLESRKWNLEFLSERQHMLQQGLRLHTDRGGKHGPRWRTHSRACTENHAAKAN